MKNRKCLFISRELLKFTGGGVITKRNLQGCKDIFSNDCVIHYTLQEQTKFKTLMANLNGYMGGLNPVDCKNIFHIIKSQEVSHVFIDSSILGRLANMIRQKFEELRIITFFHNVEYLYFKELRRVTGKKQHILSILAAKYNEKAAVKYSDVIATLNTRDSNFLFQIYGRKADENLHTSFDDRFLETNVISTPKNGPRIILFIGAYFFANIEGVRWFCKEVMPELKNYMFYIVGKDFEVLQQELNSTNVNVVGSVDDLDEYYYNADIIVSPIFSGGGMKTKIAEALMFGKTIVGTTEAFEGYELDFSKVGKLCNTKAEYVSYFKDLVLPPNKFNHYSRTVFLNNYQYSYFVNKLKNLFDPVNTDINHIS
ncbi:glycosyltransferase [Niabella sp. CJ426]|uniref:glycosyltransferase n=1 Tax=Niabella sp. CJ426 TaxID=3393740 RepID=UPI003CFEAA75